MSSGQVSPPEQADPSKSLPFLSKVFFDCIISFFFWGKFLIKSECEKRVVGYDGDEGGGVSEAEVWWDPRWFFSEDTKHTRCCLRASFGACGSCFFKCGYGLIIRSIYFIVGFSGLMNFVLFIFWFERV